MQTIFFVAGKSGGHIIPALTLAQRIAAQRPQVALGIFVNNTPLDRALIANNSYLKYQEVLPINTWFSLVRSFLKSFSVLWKTRPERVISMGGLISVPVCLAAWLLRIPFDLYELNVVPGKAVKFLAPFATNIFVCFKETLAYLPKATVAAYPVRFAENAKLEPRAARVQLGLEPDKKTILVVGGSQGSRSLNACMRALILSGSREAQIIHQTGVHDVEAMKQFYAKENVPALVFAYRDDINICYSAADLVITRAGSGALHELQFFGNRAIIVPLEIASTDHQVANAQAFVALRPAVWRMVREADLAKNDTVFYTAVQEQLDQSRP